MAKILDLEAFKRSKSGQEYIEILSAMDLFDLTDEVLEMGRLLKSRGRGLSRQEKIKAKILFEYVKGRAERDDSSLSKTVELILKFYDL